MSGGLLRRSGAVLVGCWLLGGTLGCPAQPQRPVQTTPLPGELGFHDLASADQLGPWWAESGGVGNVSQAWLSADRLSVLIHLRDAAPVGGTGMHNAALLSSAPTREVRGLDLPGRVQSVDFSRMQAVVLQPASDTDSAAGGSSEYAFDLATGQLGAELSPAAAGNKAEALAAVDSAENGVWAYSAPHAEGSGSGREAAPLEPARLTYTDDAGAQELSVDPGSVPFTQLAGNYAARRAVLAAPGAGLLLASFAGEQPQLSWLLRDSGENALFLQPDSDALLCLSDSGVRWIGLPELIELAPRLLAGQQLNAAQIKRLRPVAEALGWEWAQTQLSPLGGRAGVLHLFDAGDLDSATAEFEWEPASQRVTSLLVVRQPRSTDDKLRTGDAGRRTETVQALLALLGWPDAQAGTTIPAAAEEMHPDGAENHTSDQPESAPAGDETIMRWQLGADEASGEFNLWLTPDAAVWQLSASVEGPAAAEG